MKARASSTSTIVIELILHVVAGVLLPYIVRALCAITGAGGHQCVIFALYPVIPGLLSWYFPRGAPGAGVALAIRSLLAPPVQGGPTAKTLTEAFRVGVPLVVILTEVVVAVVRWAMLRKAASAREGAA